jgi:hypothetical protein
MTAIWRRVSSIAALLLCLSLAAWGAEESPDLAAVDANAPTPWRRTVGLEAWGYATSRHVREDSPLNAGNRILQLSSRQLWIEHRMNLRLEHEAWQIILNPRAVAQASDMSDTTSRHDITGILSQALVRYKSDNGALTAGRELLTWGPSQFRSPSNPFYFDSDRTNPLAAPAGIDLVRYTRTVNSWHVTGGYVFATGKVQPPESSSDSVLLKIDQQGRDHVVGAILAQTRKQSPFIGGFAQFTPDDAWLAYLEFGSGQRPWQLQPGTDVGVPSFNVQHPAPRTTDILFGASYTHESGQVLQAEYLHTSSGYARATERQYFNQAALAAGLVARNPAESGLIGQAVALAPRLLGRDYLWLQLGSNPQNLQSHWFANWSQNLNDRSGQAVVYVERNCAPALSGFVALVLNFGGAHTDYASLSKGSLTLGLKWFML